MSLSSLIVQREIATIRQVEEALARQVLYGGDLPTNLLEVAQVEEWRVAVTCADSFALSAAPPGKLPIPPPELLAVVPADLAAQRSILPLSRDSSKLVIAAAEPPSQRDLDQLAASAGGVRVEVRIALQVRISEALVNSYGTSLDRRLERLLAKLSKHDAPAPAPSPSQPAPKTPSSVPPFRLSPAYGVSAERSSLAPQNRAETPGPPPSQPKVGRTTQAGFPAPPPSKPSLDQTPPPAVSVPGPQPRHTGAYAESQPTFVKPTGGSVRPPRRHRGPLTASDAEKELEGAKDRDGLLDLFFEFARQFFDYAALFIAHGDIAEGRDAFGDGAPRERVVGIGVPLDMPSMLQAAREQREAAVFRPVGEGIDGILLSDLKRPPGIEAVVVPVLVRGRAVAILYADAAATIDRDGVDEVVKLSHVVGQGFERLIVRKKLAGFSGGAPKSEVGKLQRTIAVPEKAKTVEAAPEAGSRSKPVDVATQTNDKVARASALGRALFTPSKSDRPGAFRAPPEPEPQPAPAPGPSAWSRNATPSETPLARGSIPPVLVAPAASETSPPAAVEPPFPQPRPRQPASSRPPPPVAVAVHPLSDPPIPREDPEPEGDAELQTDTLDEAEAQALLAEIGESTPITEEGEEVIVEVPLAPESDQAVAVGPRRPPVAHSEVTLPSIIVDISGELAALVDRVLAGDRGPAEAELLRQGASAMSAIMARFPGPLAFSRSQLQEPLPRPSECGPLLRLIARQRKVALAYVLEEVASPDVSRRFWATYLLVELPYAEGVRRLVPRLFDPDAKVRLVARAAARATAEAAHDALFAEIGRIVREPSTSRTARLGLLEALGDLREPKAVAMLIGHLGDEDAEIATVARRSLIAITRQDHALDTRKWLAWWGQNSNRHRIEWLIDALVDETPGIRRAAGEELKNLTRETFGYYDDLPKRERERAQQRFRDWWASEGRARFVRT
jgi:Type II secretion system (T2SS), protein E, N-terminal domain